MSSQFCDLNVRLPLSDVGERVELVKRLISFGWRICAWNTYAFGKFGGKASQLKIRPPVSLNPQLIRDCEAYRGLLSGADQGPASSSRMQQLNRITITVDEISDAQALSSANEYLKPYDIVAACPGNAAVFAYLCKTAQIDIIALDFTRRVPFPLIKKQIDEAIARGVCFEVLYSPLLSDPVARKEVIAGTRNLVQFLRGRHIILSSGTDSHFLIRGPHDVMNIGILLNMSQSCARDAVTKTCEEVLRHATARRLRFLPVEVASSSDVMRRWPALQQKTLGKRKSRTTATATTTAGTFGTTITAPGDNTIITADSKLTSEDNAKKRSSADKAGKTVKITNSAMQAEVFRSEDENCVIKDDEKGIGTSSTALPVLSGSNEVVEEGEDESDLGFIRFT